MGLSVHSEDDPFVAFIGIRLSFLESKGHRFHELPLNLQIHGRRVELKVLAPVVVQANADTSQIGFEAILFPCTRDIRVAELAALLDGAVGPVCPAAHPPREYGFSY